MSFSWSLFKQADTSNANAASPNRQELGHYHLSLVGAKCDITR